MEPRGRGLVPPRLVCLLLGVLVAGWAAQSPGAATPAVQAKEGEIAAPRSRDYPLRKFVRFGFPDPQKLSVAWAAQGTLASDGDAQLKLVIPGEPVAAYLYLNGRDVEVPEFPNGDARIRVEVRSGPGAGRVTRFTQVPVRYRVVKSHTSFVNMKDISRAVAKGTNWIKVTGYDLKLAGGAFAFAVYRDAALANPRRITVLDGADFAYYPSARPLGPDSELAVFESTASGETLKAKAILVLGGMQDRPSGFATTRGDEVFLLTGKGRAERVLPDTDRDGLPDIIDRRHPLRLVDRPPLGNDWADFRGGHREAVAGAISLEEDELGCSCKKGGFSRGDELDVFTAAYKLPAGHEFAAFQVQSENPESGDSFLLFLAINELEVPERAQATVDVLVGKTAGGADICPPGRTDVGFRATLELAPCVPGPGVECGTARVKSLRDTATGTPDILVWDLTMAPPNGDANGNKILDIGEKWVLPFAKGFTGDADEEDTLVAEWDGVEAGSPQGMASRASAIARVRMYSPPTASVSLDRTAVRPGEQVNFTYTVGNPNATYAMSGVRVLENVFGDLGPIDSLLPGHTWTLSRAYTVPGCAELAGRPGYAPGPCPGTDIPPERACSLTESVTVNDPFTFALDEERCLGTAKVCLSVLNDRAALLQVTKTDWSDAVCLEAYPPARHVVTVTHAPGSAAAAARVEVTDAPAFASLTGPAGDANANNVLDIGETWTYVGTRDVIVGTFPDTVTVRWESAENAALTGTATATATATLAEYSPPLITKSVSAAVAKPGERVTYRYVVANPNAHYAMANVEVLDSVLGNLGPIASLPPLQMQTLSREYAVLACESLAGTPGYAAGPCPGSDIPAELAGRFCSISNTVTTRDPFTYGLNPEKCFGGASACLSIAKPVDIQIVKKVEGAKRVKVVNRPSPPVVVNYSFTVRVAGEGYLENVVVSDPALGLTINVGRMSAGERTFTFNLTLPANVPYDCVVPSLPALTTNSCWDSVLALAPLGPQSPTCHSCYLPNTATVTATDPVSGGTLTGRDSACLWIYQEY